MLKLTGRIAQVGGWEMDLETSSLFWSEEVYRIHEVEASWVPNVAEAISFYAEEARPVIQAAVERAIAGGPGWDLELPLITAKGRRIWVRAQGEAFGEAGRRTRLAGAFQEITQRKLAEERLRADRELMAIATKGATEGIWDWDLLASRRTIAAQFWEILGYPADYSDLTPNSLLQLHHPEDRERVAAATRRHLETGEPYQVDVRILARSGEYRWFRSRGQAIWDTAGRPVRMAGTMADITDLKRAEVALEKERAFLEMVIENLPNSCVLTFDQAGRIERGLGGSLLSRLGMTPESLLQQRVQALAPADHRGSLDTAVQDCLAGLEASTEVGSSGRRLHVTLVPLSGPADRVRHGLAVVSDTTERDLLRSQVAKQERLATIGTLSAGVGHEINNPLSFISTNLDFVAEEVRTIAGGSPSQRFKEISTALADAREGAERIRKIVRGLRSLAREESPLGPTDVAATIGVGLSMARLELGTRTKVVKTLQAVPPVLADETRLAQVFVNLLVNAGQAFAEGGAEVNHIFISTGLDADGQIVVEIRDDGPGMDSKTAARLFEPFFTTKPVGRGTGLGLAISHTAIKEFGGTLTCVTAPGKGSTFRIVLKPASAGPAGDVEVAVSSPRADRIRILVIDDEPAVTASIERVLREEHSVSVINDPREALLVLASGHSFDLVLCDLMMPELSGVDLFHRVLSSRPELAGRFAFMTGGIMFAEARRFLDKVTNERLEKPLSMEGLRGLARRYATKARIS